MRKHKLYANLKKCIFCAPEIPVLGCYVSADGVRADPEKVSSICAWLAPTNQTELRQWLGLANYLHRYTRNYALLIQPLSSLLKKDATWSWRQEYQEAFDSVKRSLSSAPILALPDDSRPFHVVCDASGFAIGCALMQVDDMGQERVIGYQSRQLKPAEKNYPVHDKELLAMRYALIKFRVHLLGEKTFAIYTDHASLRTAVKSPHLSQRMARWLSFFSEYNFVVHYKPGKSNVLADALSRRPDYDPRRDLGHHTGGVDRSEEDDCAACMDELHTVKVTAISPLRQSIVEAYTRDQELSALIKYLRTPTEAAREELPRHLIPRLDRYTLDGDLLLYSIDRFDAPRVVVPNDSDLRARLIHEYHDTPVAGHLGREKTFAALTRDYFWPHQYKWVRKWVRTCEVCQRVKPSPSSQAPLRPLPIASDSWRSVSMDFIFGLPPDARERTGVLVFVDRFSKMVHLAPVSVNVTAEDCARLFLDVVFRHHGLPESIVSDRDPRFVATFWRRLFELLGTRLLMSTAAHPETDGQTERVNRVLEDVLRSFATSFTSLSAFLPMVEFALNNSVHASTGMSPFFVNNARHPRVPALLAVGNPTPPVSTLGGGEVVDEGSASNQSVDMLARPTLVAPSSVAANAVLRSSSTASSNDSTGLARWASRTLISPGAVPSAVPNGNYAPKPPVRPADDKLASEFITQRQAIVRFVRDALQEAADKQKAAADKRGRKNTNVFQVGDRVLLSSEGIKNASVTNLGASKLAPRYIGPFTVKRVLGDAYTLDIPTTMRLHPTFYVGRLKPYYPATIPAATASSNSRVGGSRPPTSRNHGTGAQGDVRELAAPPQIVAHSPQSRLHDPQQNEQHRLAPAHLPRHSPPAPSQQSQAPPTMAPRDAAPPGFQMPFRRDAPPPLIGSNGERRWIVERIVAHEDPSQARGANRRAEGRGAAPARRRYHVRWLGFPPESETWEPRDALRRDIPDMVREYDANPVAPQPHGDEMNVLVAETAMRESPPSPTICLYDGAIAIETASAAASPFRCAPAIASVIGATAVGHQAGAGPGPAPLLPSVLVKGRATERAANDLHGQDPGRDLGCGRVQPLRGCACGPARRA